MKMRPPTVFLGPTLPHAEAEKLVDAEFHGPAAMGDITKAVSAKAELIVLVDGVFEHGPSVWHKEILWALSREIPVVGVASMGALRAAELHTLGMMGYGCVFEDFAAGRLNDDDEVAIAHGPSETGWAPLSDAMVDIRKLVHHALSLGMLSQSQGQQLMTHAKSLHFSQRSFIASARAISSAPMAALESWLKTRPSGAKDADCRSLLLNLSAIANDAKRSLRNTPPFIPTVYLSRLQKFGYTTL